MTNLNFDLNLYQKHKCMSSVLIQLLQLLWYLILVKNYYMSQLIP